MEKVEKACPIVVRLQNGKREVLAFTHPSAGNQFVKGTIGAGERTREAAVRELREESGIRADNQLISLGLLPIGESQQLWHFFKYMSSGLPQTWSYQTEDDFGHTFMFFCHPLDKPLDHQWHSIFHEAFEFFAPLCLVVSQTFGLRLRFATVWSKWRVFWSQYQDWEADQFQRRAFPEICDPVRGVFLRSVWRFLSRSRRGHV